MWTIALFGLSSDAVATGSRPPRIFTGNQTKAIVVGGCDCDVVIEDAHLVGIQIYGPVRSVTVRNVTISDWTDYGLFVVSNNSPVKSITIESVLIGPPKSGYPRYPLLLNGVNGGIEKARLVDVDIVGNGQSWKSGVENLATADQFALMNVADANLIRCSSKYGGENGFSLTYGTNATLVDCSAEGHNGQGFHLGQHEYPGSHFVIHRGRSIDNGRNALGEHGAWCGYLVHSANAEFIGVVATGQEYAVNAAATGGSFRTLIIDSPMTGRLAGFGGAVVRLVK